MLTLRERTFRYPLVEHRATSVGRPACLKQWDEERMKQAYEAVKSKKMSIRHAAEAFSVPKSTLADRASGRVKFGSHSGPERYLDDEEERQLVRFIIGCAKMGYAKTKKEVLLIAEELLANKGREITLSNGWWESFNKRHPSLTLRSAEKLSYARYVATDQDLLNNYFDLLHQTLEEYDLFESPTQIWNCDETGLPLDHKPEKVIAEKGQKHPRTITTGNKKQITVMACSSAAGRCIPPLVIYRRKTLNGTLIEGEIPGTMYGLGGSGWIDSEIFHDWFKFHFLIHAPAVRPLLLLLDGHSSHYHPGSIELAAKNRVVIFCLPPNTTHLLQPLDKGVFGPLKTHWNRACHDYMRKNPGQIITEYSFMKVFYEAFCDAMTMRNIMSAFRTTGVFPFDRSKVSALDKTRSDRLAEESGLPFLPLLSPARKHKSLCDPTPSQSKNSHEGQPESRHPLPGSTLTQTPPPSDNEQDDLVFTSEEVLLFERRVKEGYDFTPKGRYRKYLSRYFPQLLEIQPECAGEPPVATKENKTLSTLLLGTAASSSVYKKFFPPPKESTSRMATFDGVTRSGRVLTSTQYLQQLREKEALKLQKQKAAEERQRVRLQKQQEKEKAKKQGARANSAGGKTTDTVFTPEEIILFERRVEEGYDFIPEGRYREWLGHYHPELLKTNLDDEDSETEPTHRQRVKSNRQPRIDQSKGLKPHRQRVKSNPRPRTDQSEGSKAEPTHRRRVKSTHQARTDQSEGSKPHRQRVKSNRQPRTDQSEGSEAELIHRQRLKPTHQPRTDSADHRKISESQPTHYAETGSGDQDSPCVTGLCDHPRAYKWISCDKCGAWFHCVCMSVSAKNAEQLAFVCEACETL